MPRDLGDVADYFLPPAAGALREERAQAASPRAILTLPVAGRDALRAAFAWNLCVEIARLGPRVTLLAARDVAAAALWPAAGPGPLGASVHYAPSSDLEGLGRAATRLLASESATSPDGGMVVVAAPPQWLVRAESLAPPWNWWLLFGSPDSADLREAYALAKRAYRRGRDPLVGLVIHGARGLHDAERAFSRVSSVARRHLGRAPRSYGLLADELHVYRAIASRRPIGLEHPQSRAARALGDVARMLWEDASKRSDA